VSGFSTQIVFDDVRVPVEQLAATTSLGHFATPRLGWSVTAGGVLAGQIEGRDVAGGATVGTMVSWLPIYERARRPFVATQLSVSAAFVRATADDATRRDWLAFDLRAGITLGKTIAGRVVPYASARAFGGPVFWHWMAMGIVGGDRYHVTVGAGVTLRVSRSLDATAEAMPLGERSLAFGVTAHL
jgi:hypothetical protein